MMPCEELRITHGLPARSTPDSECEIQNGKHFREAILCMPKKSQT